MKLARTAKLIIGVIMVLLGLLWFFQGTGFLEVCPILCFADCECITGGSLLWMVAGAVVAACGLGLVFLKKT